MEDHPLGSQKRHISRLRDRAAVRKDSVFDLADIFRETMKSGLFRREGMTGGRKEGTGWRQGGSHCLRGEINDEKNDYRSIEGDMEDVQSLCGDRKGFCAT